MADQTFPKKIRLRSSAEFDAVFHGQTFAADDVLVMHAVKNGLPFVRLGLSVSRKVGNAVVRNRWKRTIRESFRRQKYQLPAGMDIVVRPRKGAQCEYAAVARSLEKLTARLAKKLRVES